MSGPFNFGKGRSVFTHNQQTKPVNEFEIPVVEETFENDFFPDFDLSEHTETIDIPATFEMEETSFEPIPEPLHPHIHWMESSFNSYISGSKLIQGELNEVINLIKMMIIYLIC